MEIAYLKIGEFRLKGKTATVLISDGKIDVGGFVISRPGEYEVAGVDVIVITPKVFRVTLDNISLCYLDRKLSDEEKSRIGTVNVAILPANSQYDRDLEAAYVIPYGESLEKFLKEMGAEGLQPQPKLITSVDKLPETTTVVVLNA